jgi:hypothetical protein
LATVYERTNREICLPSRNQNMAKELVLTGGSKTKQEKKTNQSRFSRMNTKQGKMGD